MKMKLFLLSFPLIISSIDIKSQTIVPFGIELRFASCYDILDSKTAHYLNNSIGFTFEDYLNIGNLFVGITLSGTSSQFRDSIKIRNQTHVPNEKFNFDASKIIFGYKFYNRKNTVSIDPYIGWVKTDFESNSSHSIYDSRIGYCCGFTINRYFRTKLKNFQPFIFLNNSINFSKLGQINNELGNFYYSCEVGAGFDWPNKRK
jgi:hypothetical protein